jgi:hypothetical protein
MKNNMPTQPVHDLKIHPRENDLIVATHGRGIYIADVSALADVTLETLAQDAFFFQPESKVRWVAADLMNFASDNFNGESEPAAIPFYYSLKSAAGRPVTFTVYQGSVAIATVEGPGEAGLHRVSWGMERRPAGAQQAAQPSQAGGRGGPARVQLAPLGDYRVVMTIGERVVGERAVSIFRDDWWMTRR